MVLFPVSNTLSVAGCNMTKLYYTILHNAPRSVSLINQSSFPPHWAIFVTNRHNQKTHVFHLTHFCFMKINCTVYPPVLCGFIDKYPVKSDFDKLWAYIKTSSFFFFWKVAFLMMGGLDVYVKKCIVHLAFHIILRNYIFLNQSHIILL